jgi:VIT1/CCC1 family predicted Fe2+/Mn2+ transporter
MPQSREHFLLYMRNFIFGAEDSLVSTVGLLSGIAVADVPRNTIFLTGVVLLFVEAFSMGVGSFLSEHATQESHEESTIATRESTLAALVMFFSYFFSGFIPLLPYRFLETSQAFPTSIIAALVTLFIVGLGSAKILKTRLLNNGLKMLVLGGIAIGLGIIVGQIVQRL